MCTLSQQACLQLKFTLVLYTTTAVAAAQLSSSQLPSAASHPFPFIAGGYLASAASFCTSGLYFLQLRAAASHVKAWSFVYSVRYVYILSTPCALPLLAYASVRLQFTHVSYYQALLPL